MPTQHYPHENVKLTQKQFFLSLLGGGGGGGEAGEVQNDNKIWKSQCMFIRKSTHFLATHRIVLIRSSSHFLLMASLQSMSAKFE